jgi:hypothetical protein
VKNKQFGGENKTIHPNSRARGPAVRELRDALQAIPLTRDGTVPLDSTCPAFREATLGPAGSYLTHTGVVVATDGSVKDDGRMGAAYVALDNTDRLPPRSLVVLGPPSSLRGQLSGIDAAVADAPGDSDEELTILTDSLQVKIHPEVGTGRFATAGLPRVARWPPGERESPPPVAGATD